MSFDIRKLFDERNGENYSLHSRFINPQFAKVLKTIGYDKVYATAKGPFLFDRDGNEYLDFLSGYGVYAVGRNHPTMKKVLHDFLDMDIANLVQMEGPLLSGLLAEALVKKINLSGVDTAFFTNSGTEANEGAIKYARAATGRERILFFDHAFHGLTTGSLALNGCHAFRDGFGNLLPGCEKMPLNDLDRLEKELKKGDVAALFFEPIQGKGVFVPNDSFLPEAQKLCRKEGTLFVADEVQTGLGRTGKWFGHQHWNLEPDIVTVAKALSGGMVPVGALLCRRSIYDKVFSRMDRCVVHSSTFGQNNLAMVCGLASLSIIEEEGLVERSRMVGERLLSGLKKIAGESEWISEVRGRGLMIGIEFGKPESLSNKMKWNLVHQLNASLFGELIVMALMERHRILTQVSGHEQEIVKILPPLVIDETHCDRFLAAFSSVMADCGRVTGPIWQMGKNLMREATAQST